MVTSRLCLLCLVCAASFYCLKECRAECRERMQDLGRTINSLVEQMEQLMRLVTGAMRFVDLITKSSRPPLLLRFMGDRALRAKFSCNLTVPERSTLQSCTSPNS